MMERADFLISTILDVRVGANSKFGPRAYLSTVYPESPVGSLLGVITEIITT